MPSKIFLPLIVVFAWTSAGKAQSDIRYGPVSATPYDSQLNRVHRYLNAKRDPAGQKLTLAQVNSWMDQLRDIPYEFSPAWKTPDELKSTARGDCKAKSISLYYLMKASGAKNLLLVIGREKYSTPESHSWLIWNVGGRHYLLDPTNNSKAVEIHTFDPDHYIPHFAFSAKKKFRPEVISPVDSKLNASHLPARPLLLAARE